MDTTETNKNLDDLTQSIIRIVDAEGGTRGTGFVLSDTLAITCAHVVMLAGSGPDQTLNIYFYPGNVPQTVRVHKQGYVPRESDNDNVSLDDVAFLKLTGLPDGVRPVALGSAKSSIGHKYYSFGFPQLGEYEERHVTGQTIGGVVNHSRKRPMLQLNGDLIKQGLSGAPVLDTKIGQVIGMVNEFKDDRGNEAHPSSPRLSWATTVDTLIELWPELKTYPPPDPYTQKLNEYRDYIREETRNVTMKRDYLRPEVPLDEVYIQLQTVEQETLELQRAAEQRELDKAIGAIIRQFSKKLYRQGSLYHIDKLPPPISPTQALKEHKRLVILGAPGSGKSTLLRWLARQAILPGNELNELIPILVSARDFSTDYKNDSNLSLGDFAFKQIKKYKPGVVDALQQANEQKKYYG